MHEQNLPKVLAEPIRKIYLEVKFRSCFDTFPRRIRQRIYAKKVTAQTHPWFAFVTGVFSTRHRENIFHKQRSINLL